MLFTLLTISQEARTRELKSWVQHYSRCHSIKEIVIVWNQGLAPKVRQAYSTQAGPFKFVSTVKGSVATVVHVPLQKSARQLLKS